MRTGWPVLVVFLWACGGETVTLYPVVDTPSQDDNSYPYDNLTRLQVSIAHQNDSASLAVSSVELGQKLTLDNVEYGDDLVLHLSGLVDDLEVSYGRSCAFAFSPDIAISTPHLYFSRIVKWSEIELDFSLDQSPAYAGPDGVVYILHEGKFSKFLPLSGTFSVGEMMPDLVRRQATLVGLPDGRGLLLGGLDAEGALSKTIVLVDPRSSTSGIALETQPFDGLIYGSASLMVDGRVLLAGGIQTDGENQPPQARAFLLSLGDGGVLGPPQALPEGLVLARRDHSATRLGDDVGANLLMVGGRDSTGQPIAQAELFRPLQERFLLLPNAFLQIPRWGHQTIRVPGGFLLVLGGFTLDENGAQVPVTTAEIFDPLQGAFTRAGELPSGAAVSDFSFSLLPDQRVLIAGGSDAAGNAVDSAFIARLDSINGQIDFSPTDHLALPRRNHAAVTLCDGTVMLLGGSPASSTIDRYNPPSHDRR